MTTIAVLGLGEAGGEIARDLLAAGARVRAYDPAVPAAAGTVACRDEADAATDADVVLSVNHARAATQALRAGLRGVAPHAVWADLNTAPPELEEQLAAIAAQADTLFADVSLMAPVPGKGLRTPMLASGTGAAHYAGVLGALGAHIEVIDGPAGVAAQRKLLRSVFFKGMAATVTEALHAARAAGLEPWMRELIEREFDEADGALVERLESGSRQHAVRRIDEMTAATQLLGQLGVPARISSASRDWLRDLAAEAGSCRRPSTPG